ncbi:hypothetical protein EV1_019885 [Malus domestica]
MAIPVHLAGPTEASSTASRYPGASGCRRPGPSVQTHSARRRSSKPEAGNRTGNLCRRRNPRVPNSGWGSTAPFTTSDFFERLGFFGASEEEEGVPFFLPRVGLLGSMLPLSAPLVEALGGFRLCDLGGLSSKNCGLKAFNFKDSKATPFEMTLLGLMTRDQDSLPSIFGALSVPHVLCGHG